MGTVRKLTQAEIDAFPGVASVDVAIASHVCHDVWFYGDSNPTAADPSGIRDAQYIIDEDGDYISLP